jgi:hypothetical protein
MRFPFAVQVFSQRSARAQERAAHGESASGRSPLPLPEQGPYSSLIALTRHLGRVVDIMNARKERGAPSLNSSHHPVVTEALDILEWFADWEADLRARGEDMKAAFFNKELWE